MNSIQQTQRLSQKSYGHNQSKKTIGYEPKTTLKDGLQATWDWFMANREEFLKRKNYFK